MTSDLTIASTIITKRFFLAPMAGYSDLAFRMLCREFGAGLCYSEMIHCDTLLQEDVQSLALAATCEDDQPVAIQLYGSNPENMAAAAEILCQHPITFIDINMGCPAQKVMNMGAGAALMRSPKQAEKIIAAVCRKSSLPVTVKIRSGSHQHSITAPLFAKIAEDSGAQAIAIHARTCSQGFSGSIDHALLKTIKQQLSIPVIGNGDINTYQQGLDMLEKTGCDAVMIGRAAIGAPWIFSPTTNIQPTQHMRIKTLRCHLALIQRHCDETYSFARIKNHAWKYFQDQSNIRTIRQKINNSRSLTGLIELAENWFQTKKI